MTKKTEFVIKHDGSMIRRDIAEQEINITEKFIAKLSRNVIRKVRDAFPLSYLNGNEDDKNDYVHASIGSAHSMWWLPVKTLNLTAPFKCADGILWPEFDSKNPILKIKWKSPLNADIRLGVVLDDSLCCTAQYLTALDCMDKVWRLPLSNLYNDCKLCHGAYPGRQACVVEALAAALFQFENSYWNSDLYVDATAEIRSATSKMFRFKAEGKGFSQEPIFSGDENWTKWCQKIGSQFIAENTYSYGF